MSTAKMFVGLFLILILAGCGSSKETKFDDYVFKTKSDKQNYTATYDKALQLWDVPYTEENVKTTFGTAHVIISGQKKWKRSCSASRYGRQFYDVVSKY